MKITASRWARAGAILCAGLLVAGTAGAASIFQIADPVEFNNIIDTNTAVVMTNATDNAWLEGPVWVPSGGGYLLFCDQGNNKLKKIVLPNTVSDFIDPAANTIFNGTTLDAQERLIAAEAGSAGLKIVMVTNGLVTTLCSSCNGWSFYSPNDVVVKNDGTIWFTDPAYNGVAYSHTGYAPELYVYRFNPTNGNQSCFPVITNSIVKPNGLCFSPDQSLFYVADSDTSTHYILRYNVSPSNTLSGRTVFATITNGIPDGIRCDADGRIWSSGGDGIYIFASDGHMIGKLKLWTFSNLCFGGDQYKTLFMTGQPQVVSIRLKVAGEPAIKSVQAAVSGGALNLSWPAPSTGFVLQECDDLSAASNWFNNLDAQSVTNGSNVVTIGLTNRAAFYRLQLN